MTADWRAEAACRGMDAELFYPARGEWTHIVPPAVLAICQACPVRPDCLHEALGNHERHGIWGGLSERQRRRIRMSRTLTAVPAAAEKQVTPAALGLLPGPTPSTTCPQPGEETPRATPQLPDRPGRHTITGQLTARPTIYNGIQMRSRLEAGFAMWADRWFPGRRESL